MIVVVSLSMTISQRHMFGAKKNILKGLGLKKKVYGICCSFYYLRLLQSKEKERERERASKRKRKETMKKKTHRRQSDTINNKNVLISHVSEWINK
jgi:hypothetical protein